MPDVRELTRRARRAEAAGDVRGALACYREALRMQRHGDAEERDAAEIRLRMADLLLSIGDPQAAVDALGDADDVLARTRDQDLCVAVARVLADAGEADRAASLCRRVWEERTGRREPAGRIEDAVRGLGLPADPAEWTPRWPDRGEDAVAAEWGTADPTGEEAPDGERLPGGGRPDGGDARPATGTGPLSRSYPDRIRHALGEVTPADRPRRLRVREAGKDDDARPGPGPRGSPDDGAPPTGDSGGSSDLRHGDPTGGSDGGGVGPPRPGNEGRPAPGRPDAEDRGPASPAALRDGLQLLEELLELAPGDAGLIRRKIAYAERLRDREKLVEALCQLAEALARDGALRAAHLLVLRVRHELDPAHEAAAAADARLRDRWSRSDRLPPPRIPAGTRLSGGAAAGEPPDGSTADAGPSREDLDRRLRRAVSEALEGITGELEELYAAAREAGRPGEDGRVPWAAHYRLGRHLLAKGRPEEALLHLDVARLEGAAEGEAHRDLEYLAGVSLLLSGRPGAARRRFDALGADELFVLAMEIVLPDGPEPGG